MISTLLSRRRSLFGLLGGIASVAGGSRGIAAAAAREGPVILTVGGLLGAPNRGPIDPKRDRFFDHNNIGFDRARAFSFADLAALPQKTVLVKTGEGKTPFKGPLLHEIIKVAAPAGEVKFARLSALDGYAAEFPLADIASQDWILATEAGGSAFGIGDFGPLYAARQLEPNEKKTEEEGAKWVFSIYYIELAA